MIPGSYLYRDDGDKCMVIVETFSSVWNDTDFGVFVYCNDVFVAFKTWIPSVARIVLW